MRNYLKRVLPAPAYNALKRLAGRPVYQSIEEGEKGSDYYDRTFDADEYWKQHYTKTEDYACWTVIIDRLRNFGARRLLEIGCGSGQLAHALLDAGFLDSYCGFDFSSHRLAQARLVCPGFSFEQADAFRTDLFESHDYDSALSTEFLEHVQGDLEVLNKLKPGTKFIGSVPNFPFVSHVRHFRNCEEVAERYGPLFKQFSVAAIQVDPKGKTLFVLQGVR
jgi:SAM-dependent methyltransferase